jgi:hypothetical protein
MGGAITSNPILSSRRLPWLPRCSQPRRLRIPICSQPHRRLGFHALRRIPTRSQPHDDMVSAHPAVPGRSCSLHRGGSPPLAGEPNNGACADHFDLGVMYTQLAQGALKWQVGSPASKAPPPPNSLILDAF